MLTNEILCEFRFRSFLINGELICKILVLYLKTSISGWTSLTINEGISIILREKSEPRLLDLNEINDEFAYPIQRINLLDYYIGRKITSIYEYRNKNMENGCIGIYIEFNNQGLSVMEYDGCLEIIDGDQSNLKQEIVLSKITT